METEKLKLTQETYYNIKSMLESPDEENLLIGLSCVENSDLKLNLTYVLLLFKECNILQKNWVKHAPKTMELLKNVLGQNYNATITFNIIMENMAIYKVPEEDYQFLMNRYAGHLLKKFKNLEDIQIIIKTKPNESGTIS